MKKNVSVYSISIQDNTTSYEYLRDNCNQNKISYQPDCYDSLPSSSSTSTSSFDIDHAKKLANQLRQSPKNQE